MVTVTLNANGHRNTILANENQKLNDFIAEQNLNSNVIPYLDGAPLTKDQLNKTFAENGIEDTCVISSIIKTNNA